jgi:hypothetical protein
MKGEENSPWDANEDFQNIRKNGMEIVDGLRGQGFYKRCPVV